jgi:short-subunit dehydrogenase
MATDTTPAAKPKTAQTARKRALVTGASSGLGEEFARQLAERGYDLIIVARRKDRLQKLAAELGGNVEVLEADLTQPAGVDAVSSRLARGDIDMLVNNAGFGTNGEFAGLPVERELEEIDLNVRALTQLSHAALGPMKARHAGTIINVASTASYQPVPYMATYAATKAYVLYLSEALHEEAKSYGVTVTCLCPGFTKTEFHEQAGVTASGMMVRYATAESVVKAALTAAKSGSAIVVPGTMNKVSANLGRISPRFMVRKVAGSMFKPKSG